MQALKRITKTINGWSLNLLIFMLLISNYCIYGLNGNEEMYMQLAKQFYDPTWIRDSFTLTQFPSNRLLYQYFAGFLLEFFKFEVAAQIGRFFIAGLFAFPLARLFRHFKISNLEALLLLQLVFIPQQSFIASSWMFLSFESKGLSYPFILWAIYYLLKNDYLKVVLLAALATYFHVLVGLWFFLAVSLYQVFQSETFKDIIIRGLGYTVLVLPMVAYLASEILFSEAPADFTTSIDWIYTYYRNPHHTTPFRAGEGYFMSHWFEGCVQLVLFWLLALTVFRFASVSESFQKEYLKPGDGSIGHSFSYSRLF